VGENPPQGYQGGLCIGKKLQEGLSMRVVRIISVLISLLFFQSVPVDAAPDYTKTPVFFVHGHGLNANSWATMISSLTDAGYPPEYLEAIQLVPNDGANIPAAEEQIAPAIETFLDSINTFLAVNYPAIPLNTKVNLVSHSMGSMSSRWYAARVRPDRVHKWVSLAGANHGTNDLCGFPEGGADDLCPAYATSELDSFIQFTLNGAPFVADVDETPYGIGQDSPGVVSVPSDQNRQILYVTIRTSPDIWIDPEDSVILDGTGGVQIPIPGDLPATMTSEGNFLMTNGVGHDPMLSDPETMRLVKIILDLDQTLVAAYSFDEGSGSIVNDASGSGNHGTITGAVWTSGQFESGLQFDGVDDFVQVSDHPSLHLTDEGTISAWVYPNSRRSFDRIIAKDESSPGRNDAFVISLGNTADRIQIAYKNYQTEGFYTPVGSLSLNQWHHIAFVFTTSAVQFYIDGVLQSLSGAGTINYGGNENLRIGIRGDGVQDFDGIIDNVRIYNLALNTSEIQMDMNNPVTPSISIGDVAVTEGDAGTVDAVFAVSLSAPTGLDVSVDYDTADGTAVAGGDYEAASDTLFFPAGTTTQTITVVVNGDFSDEPDETFFVNLSNAINANIANDQGRATIIDDDEPPPPQNLMAAYGFDEGSGSTVSDASGNGNDGIISGASWTSQGRFGSGLVFDGIDDWVTIDDATSLDLTTGMTLEAWVYPTEALSGWSVVILKEQPGGSVYYLAPNSHLDQPATGIFNGGSRNIYGGTSLAPNTWTHLAATYDGTTQRLYINGVEVDNTAQTGEIQMSDSPLRICGNSIWGEYFPGIIDEVRIYSRALTASEIQTDMSTPVGPPITHSITIDDVTVTEGDAGTVDAVFTVSLAAPTGVDVSVDYATEDGTAVDTGDYEAASGTLFFPAGSTSQTILVAVNGDVTDEPDETFFVNLSNPINATISDSQGRATIIDDDEPPPPPPVAAYSFDEGSGSTVSDASGNGNDGIISGTSWTSQGRFGSGLVFDGVDDWVTILDDPSLDLTTEMTLEAWVYPTVPLSGWSVVIVKERPGGSIYYLAANSHLAQPATGVFIGGWRNLYGGTSLAPNTWTHLAATYDGTTQRLYINGVEVDNKVQTGEIETSDGPLRIGGNSIWGEYFPGRIDEIRIYNRALNTSEIQMDMNTPLEP